MNIKLLTIKYDNNDKKCTKDFFNEVNKDFSICVCENDNLNIVASSYHIAFFGIKIFYRLEGDISGEFMTKGVKPHSFEEDIKLDKDYFEKLIKFSNKIEIKSNLEIFINSFEISLDIIITDKNKFYKKIKKHVKDGISSYFSISPHDENMFEGMEIFVSKE